MRATLLVLLLTPAAGFGQVERYELGRRLKRFEAEWEKVTDPAARKRALAIIPKASTQFLSLNLPEAARTVDDAYWALKSAEPPAAGVRWLESLCLVPEKRAVEADARTVRVTVRPLYPVPGGPPADATAWLAGPRGARVEVPLDKLPAAVEVPTRRQLAGPRGRKPFDPPRGTPFDGYVLLDARLGDRPAAECAVRVSFLGPLPPTPAGGPPLEAATAAEYRRQLAALRADAVPETDLPAVEWADRLRRLGEPFFTPDRAGDWSVSVPADTGATACRLFVPPGLSTDKPVPLVVALHGAGGSENMFFESYGAGHIVTECRQRGWLLLAPRCGFFGPPPVADLVQKLRERYPIDPKRVFLVGHSMGAGQAVELFQKHPDAFAAVAVLGGGGRVRHKDAFTNRPVFVGMGTADFALRSGKALVKALSDAGAKHVTAKEYPGLEHLLIVREALPDVFRMFDGSTP